MPTAIDDLKPGMFIAIVDGRAPEPPASDGPFGMPFWIGSGPSCRQSVRCGGEPLEVLAISLPFVCVTNGSQRYAIDVRDVDVQKLDRTYVRHMQGANECREFTTVKKKRRKAKPDPKKCPRCGCKRVERLIEPGAGKWNLHCPQCGMSEAPPVPV